MSRYHFFGGKGGVGKTTAASATALFLLNKLKPTSTGTLKPTSTGTTSNLNPTASTKSNLKLTASTKSELQPTASTKSELNPTASTKSELQPTASTKSELNPTASTKSEPGTAGVSPAPSILLFSTDPAHSLSDSLGVKVGNRLVEVAEHKGAKLIAYEMDAALALERFREAHGKVLAEIAERGTLLDEDDVNELLNLSLPGLDEVMSLFELSELDRKGAYAHIVVDTAPSGHTSRLLRLPEVFTRMVHALDRMGEKHRYMVQHFARRRVVADEVDLFLQDLTARIQSVRSLLYDPEQTSFTLVAIPEAMSVRETQRYLTLLQEQSVPVTDLIVNRVEQEHDACVYCKARVKTQRPWLKEIEKLFGDLRLHYVPLQVEEVRGMAALEKIGRQIWKGI